MSAEREESWAGRGWTMSTFEQCAVSVAAGAARQGAYDGVYTTGQAWIVFVLSALLSLTVTRGLGFLHRLKTRQLAKLRTRMEANRHD